MRINIRAMCSVANAFSEDCSVISIRKRINMKSTTYIIATLSVIISVAVAKPEYHRIKVHFGEDVTAFEDVMVDEEAKLLIGTVAKVTSDRVTPSISYHDFSVGFSVLKLVQKGVCYIEREKHTFEELKDVIFQAEKNDGNYQIKKRSKCISKTYIEQEEVGERYGERIAAFCKDYESIFVEKEYRVRGKRELIAFGEDESVCVICSSGCS